MNDTDDTGEGLVIMAASAAGMDGEKGWLSKTSGGLLQVINDNFDGLIEFHNNIGKVYTQKWMKLYKAWEINNLQKIEEDDNGKKKVKLKLKGDSDLTNFESSLKGLYNDA